MMCIGARMAVVGYGRFVPTIGAVSSRSLRDTGRESSRFGYDEIEQFAGNMLELASWDEALGDSRVLVMSDAARQRLRPEAFTRLSAEHGLKCCVPVPTIERLGGGSVRCMLAEVFVCNRPRDPRCRARIQRTTVELK